VCPRPRRETSPWPGLGHGGRMAGLGTAPRRLLPMSRRASSLVSFSLGLIVAAALLPSFRDRPAAARPDGKAVAPGPETDRSLGLDGPLAGLAILKDWQARRISSYDPKG